MSSDQQYRRLPHHGPTEWAIRQAWNAAKVALKKAGNVFAVKHKTFRQKNHVATTYTGGPPSNAVWEEFIKQLRNYPCVTISGWRGVPGLIANTHMPDGIGHGVSGAHMMRFVNAVDPAKSRPVTTPGMPETLDEVIFYLHVKWNITSRHTPKLIDAVNAMGHSGAVLHDDNCLFGVDFGPMTAEEKAVLTDMFIDLGLRLAHETRGGVAYIIDYM